MEVTGNFSCEVHQSASMIKVLHKALGG